MEDKYITLKLDYQLRDMFISALRYAIGRKSYIVDETIEFIMSHPELIDDRTRSVMLNDLHEVENFYGDSMVDRHTFINEFYKLKGWLYDRKV